MKNLISKISLVCFLLALVGCGFHLRGRGSDDYHFPYKKVYLQCDTPVICPGLKATIKAEELTTLVNKRESAEAIIVVNNEQTSRDALDYNSTGQIASFILTYRVTAEVFDLQGNQIGNDIIAENQMTINYNNSLILSAQQQEATTWDQIHQNIIHILIRRLVYSHPQLVSTYATESH